MQNDHPLHALSLRLRKRAQHYRQIWNDTSMDLEDAREAKLAATIFEEIAEECAKVAAEPQPVGTIPPS